MKGIYLYLRIEALRHRDWHPEIVLNTTYSYQQTQGQESCPCILVCSTDGIEQTVALDEAWNSDISVENEESNTNGISETRRNQTLKCESRIYSRHPDLTWG